MKKLKLEELNRISVNEFKESNKIPVVVLLDNIRSMNNVGSFFRTSDAFRIEKIYLCGITPKPPHREIQKTALGATESVDWEHRKEIQELITELKQNQYKIIGIEQTSASKSLQNYPISKGEKYALIFGNEVEGIQDEVVKIIDECIEIPQEGTKHSFNVSVCGGIVLWEFYKGILG
ncbi:MAG: RNA methyltransferase [Flavobacteriales bacterium]|nr:RNA methyltransferase [Flavobacteriales bacterium]